MRRIIAFAIGASLLIATLGCSSVLGQSNLSKSKPHPNSSNKGLAQKDENPKSLADKALATGLRYERSGNDRLARVAYLEAVENDPESVVAHHRLGAACDRLGKFDEAEQHYKTALELSPQNADIYNDLGYSYYLSARPAEAEKALRQCLAINPRHARAHTNLGLVLGRMGREQESLAEFRRAGATAEQAAVSLAFVHPRPRNNPDVTTASLEVPANPKVQLQGAEPLP